MQKSSQVPNQPNKDLNFHLRFTLAHFFPSLSFPFFPWVTRHVVVEFRATPQEDGGGAGSAGGGASTRASTPEATAEATAQQAPPWCREVSRPRIYMNP